MPQQPDLVEITVIEPAASASSEPSYPTAPATPRSVGEQLIAARTARNENIGTIAAYLRIKPEYLYAFEQGRHDQLPALTYTLGFLRSYSDYLGLDGLALRDAFRREMMDKLTPQLNMPQPLPEARVPPLPIILGALLIGVVIAGGWYFASSTQRAAILPPVPPGMSSPATSTPASPTPTGNLVAVPDNLPTPAAREQHFGELTKPTRFNIRAEADVWLTITDEKDNVLFSQMMYAGDTYHVPDQPGLKLTAANAGALQLQVGALTLPPLGKQGQVIRDIPLDTIGKPPVSSPASP